MCSFVDIKINKFEEHLLLRLKRIFDWLESRGETRNVILKFHIIHIIHIHIIVDEIIF